MSVKDLMMPRMERVEESKETISCELREVWRREQTIEGAGHRSRTEVGATAETLLRR